MNWLTWRQFRSQALAGYAGLALMGALLALTGVQIFHTFNASGLARCLAHANEGCGDLAGAFEDRYRSTQFAALFFLVVPVLVGMFWGAPLVARELANGTHRLAWTQSVTRRRWIVSKLAVIGASTLAFSVVLSWAVSWWTRPMVASGWWNRFDPGIFDQRGVVPIAYTLFAVALGVALGALIRKTLPAVFATLAIYATVRVTIILFLREHYMAAKTVVYGFGGRAERVGDWVLSRATIDGAGRVVGQRGLDFGYLASHCPGLVPANGDLIGKGDAAQCFDKLGLHTSVLFQPASRFWTFQAIETAIFLALTALLVVFIIRRVKRVA